ncbi:hypothetical protein FQN60_012317, partial [Etheostoma spectabile]
MTNIVTRQGVWLREVGKPVQRRWPQHRSIRRPRQRAGTGGKQCRALEIERSLSSAVFFKGGSKTTVTTTTVRSARLGGLARSLVAAHHHSAESDRPPKAILRHLT